MQTSSKTVFNWILNALAIVCVCYIAWSYGNHLFFPHRASSGIRVGYPLRLNATKWDAPSKKTLVMFLSTNCTYCRQSAEFYRRFLMLLPPGEIRVIAAFKESPEEGRAYMTSMGIGEVTDVRQVDLVSANVTGTPTLVVVDRAGLVRSLWTGFLPKQGQDEVLSALDVNITGSSEAPRATSQDAKTAAKQLKRELGMNRGVAVIDVRDRNDFAAQHLAVAANIPIDELEMRLAHEVDKTKPVRLYCEFRMSCNDLTHKGITGICDFTEQILRDQGYKDVGIIYADLPALSSVGIPVVAGT
jgi:hypothetical protein